MMETTTRPAERTIATTGQVRELMEATERVVFGRQGARIVARMELQGGERAGFTLSAPWAAALEEFARVELQASEARERAGK